MPSSKQLRGELWRCYLDMKSVVPVKFPGSNFWESFRIHNLVEMDKLYLLDKITRFDFYFHFKNAFFKCNFGHNFLQVNPIRHSLGDATTPEILKKLKKHVLNNYSTLKQAFLAFDEVKVFKMIHGCGLF